MLHCKTKIVKTAIGTVNDDWCWLGGSPQVPILHILKSFTDEFLASLPTSSCCLLVHVQRASAGGIYKLPWRQTLISFSTFLWLLSFGFLIVMTCLRSLSESLRFFLSSVFSVLLFTSMFLFKNYMDVNFIVMVYLNVCCDF